MYATYHELKKKQVLSLMLLRKKYFSRLDGEKNNILIPEMFSPISSGWQHQACKQKKKFSGSAGSTQTAV